MTRETGAGRHSRRLGAKVSDNVSKKTTALVVGEEARRVEAEEGAGGGCAAAQRERAESASYAG